MRFLHILGRSRISGIYAIKNTLNGKFYVGSSLDVRRRWYDHRARLRRGTSAETKLLNSWKRHGTEAFVFMFLEQVQENRLLEREQFWAEVLRATDEHRGLNVLSPSQRIYAPSRLGRKHTDATKRKMSEAHLGKVFSIEHRINLSLSQKGLRHRSPEHRAKLSASLRGRIMSPEAIEKTAAAHRGKRRPNEIKEKISAGLVRYHASKQGDFVR